MRRNHLLPTLLLAAGLLRAECPKVALIDPVPTVDVDAAAKAYRRGLDYLVKSQNANGSWGSFESARADEVYLDNSASYQAFGDASTALCVMALLAPSRNRTDAMNALEKGLHYVIETRPPGRASGKTFYSVWTHTYIIEALCAVLQDERFSALHESARKTVRVHLAALGEMQGAEGGFGYYDFNFGAQHPRGDFSTSFNNSAVLLALEQAKAAKLDVSEQMMHDTLSSLVRLHLGTGAYTYGTYILKVPQHLANNVKGSLGRSQGCNLALWHNKAAGVTLDDLRTGLQNLFKYHEFIEMGKGRPIPHEAWYNTAGYYFLFGHYYASRVARELPAPERKKYLDGLAAILTRLQDNDGSWWDFPLYGYHKSYGTAFALMTLEP